MLLSECITTTRLSSGSCCEVKLTKEELATLTCTTTKEAILLLLSHFMAGASEPAQEAIFTFTSFYQAEASKNKTWTNYIHTHTAIRTWRALY